MNTRSNDRGSPEQVFRPATLTPQVDSASIPQVGLYEEFCTGIAKAMATAEGHAAARRAYNHDVALAAYYLAQQRRFEPGHEIDDRLAAEARLAIRRKEITSEQGELQGKLPAKLRRLHHEDVAG